MAGDLLRRRRLSVAVAAAIVVLALAESVNALVAPLRTPSDKDWTAAAALVCAVVYAADGAPIRWWLLSLFWLALLALLAFLMVSTWRYPSFKEINLLRPRSPLTVILICCVFYLIWNF